MASRTVIDVWGFAWAGQGFDGPDRASAGHSRVPLQRTAISDRPPGVEIGMIRGQRNLECADGVTESAGGSQRSPLVWAGYLACGWGLAFAAISFYWGSGGTLGIDTVWGSLGMSPAQKTVLIVAAWVTGFLKVLGAVLALALVTRWGARLPPRPTAFLSWAAAVLLTFYGGVNVLAEALTAARVVKPTQPVDWKPLLWHLYVWDMSFLFWGILLGLAAWHFTRSASRGQRQHNAADGE